MGKHAMTTTERIETYRALAMEACNQAVTISRSSFDEQGNMLVKRPTLSQWKSIIHKCRAALGMDGYDGRPADLTYDELLAGCKAFVRWVDECWGTEQILNRDLLREYEAAKAAIAKAEGKTK